MPVEETQPVRFTVRRWVDGQEQPTKTYSWTPAEFDAKLERLAEQHARESDSLAWMIEVEFLDEPNLAERYLRFGTDPTFMRQPLRLLVPGFWRNETSGVLVPAVQAYLKQETMTEEQIAAMRGYLRQWIQAPGFMGPEIEGLRDGIDSLVNQANLRSWINRAVAAGADPL